MENPYRVERLTRQHDRSSFACGEPALDRYLRQQARQDDERDIARVYVMVAVASGAVVGFYTLAATSVRPDFVPEAMRKGLPPSQDVPLTLLGRLAVRTEQQGEGLGRGLVADALRATWSAGRVVGSYGLLLHALNDGLIAFYRRLGFLSLEDAPRHLFLPMRTIGRIVGPDGDAA